MNLHTEDIQCPYCGQLIDVVVDVSIRNQQYFEDCSVCCRPMVVSVVTSLDGVESIQARTEDE